MTGGDRVLRPAQRAILVHGFNVRDHGVNTVGMLRQTLGLLGYASHVFRYGWLGVIGVYVWNDNASRLLADIIADSGATLLVGHSNGCALIHRAMWLLSDEGYQPPQPLNALYISPALDRDAVVSPVAHRVGVLYTPHDWAVRVSRYLPGVEWGDMGARGPLPGAAKYLPKRIRVPGHSAWFRERFFEDDTVPAIRELHHRMRTGQTGPADGPVATPVATPREQ